MIAISIIAFLYIFWILYIAIMGAYRAHLAGRLAGLSKLLAYPLVITGFTADALCQYTLATLLFFDLPMSKEYLVTSRLQRYISIGTGWRYDLAKYICNNLLDIFDPSGKHC